MNKSRGRVIRLRYLEQELYDYHHNLQELKDLEEEIEESSPEPADGMPRGGMVSNPTESKALQKITSRELIGLKRRVMAVQRVLERYRDNHHMMRLIELRYFRATHTPVGVARELHIGTNTFYRWRREILDELAQEMGMSIR